MQEENGLPHLVRPRRRPTTKHPELQQNGRDGDPGDKPKSERTVDIQFLDEDRHHGEQDDGHADQDGKEREAENPKVFLVTFHAFSTPKGGDILNFKIRT